MKFRISSTLLSNRLLTLSRVINNKNATIILDCFLFAIKDGQLTVIASDNENVMQSTLPLDESDGECEFCVDHRTVLSVKELPEQPLDIEVNMDEHVMNVNYQNGQYNFPVISAEEYPRPTGVDENEAITITVDAGRLNDNITRSLFATAQDELRPVMNGIYFDITKDNLAVVATDGHKLVRNRDYSVQSEQPASFILPKKPATLLKGVLANDGSDVVVKFDSKCATFNYADGKLQCRLIEGRFPNYNSVIPENNPNQITIDRKSLVGALRRVLPFASDSSQLIRFQVEFGKVELRAEDIDFSTKAIESIVCSYTGNPMSIGFKGSGMLEILNNLDSDDVLIELADPSRSGVIEPVTQPENVDVLMLIMPMLLND